MVYIFLYLSLFIFILSSILCCYYKGYGYIPVVLSAYFIFILIIPALFHVQLNVFPFYQMSYPYEQQLQASILLFVSTIFLWFGFFIKKNNYIKNNFSNTRVFDNKEIDKTRFIIVLYFLYIILIGYIAYYGVSSFLLRRVDFTGENFGEESPLRDLIITGFKALSFSVLFYIIVFRKKINKILSLISIIIALTIFFIINFPLALPRFILFSYIIVFLCYYFKVTFKSKFIFLISFGFGITTLFPFVSHITRGDGEFQLNIGEYYSKGGDFDSFQSIINTVIYVEKNGFTYGNQLLSSILSFIPRSIWESKGEPTGSIAAEAAGYSFLNISSPIPAEFYIDFGFVGLIIFSFIFGYFLRFLDQIFLYSEKSKLKYVISIILISMIVILSRGPILGVLNTIYSEVFIFVFLYFMFFYKVKFR